GRRPGWPRRAAAEPGRAARVGTWPGRAARVGAWPGRAARVGAWPGRAARVAAGPAGPAGPGRVARRPAAAGGRRGGLGAVRPVLTHHWRSVAMQIGVVLPQLEIGADPAGIRAYAQGAEEM